MLILHVALCVCSFHHQNLVFVFQATVFLNQVNLLCSAPYRAGFARQGAKEKQLLKDNNAFNVSSFVLRAMMSGQYWPEGDEIYHAELTVPILLVHGMHDKFVPVEEDQRMAEVSAPLQPSKHRKTDPTKDTLIVCNSFPTIFRQMEKGCLTSGNLNS